MTSKRESWGVRETSVEGKGSGVGVEILYARNDSIVNKFINHKDLIKIKEK